MTGARIAALMLQDPAVRSAVESVFGKADAEMLGAVISSPPSVVAKFGSTMPKAAVPKPFGGAGAALPKPKVARVTPPRTPSPSQSAQLAKPVKPLKPLKPASLSKSDPDDVDLTVTTSFSKTDDEQRTVFGWASITEVDGSPVVDRQGDMIDIEELSKSAYDYVVNNRTGGHQHRRTEEDVPLKVSDMIESVVFTPDKIEKMGLPPTTPIGWWVGYRVTDDDIWDEVKKGNITGFSVHGKGRRIPVGG